jgi:hypothetical protein
MNGVLQKPVSLREAIATGASAAVGGVTVWTLIQKLSAEQLVALAQDLGGYFLIVVGFLWLGNRFGGRFIDTARDTASALGKLSTAVELIAGKDDRRAQEHDLILGHLARNSERLVEGHGEVVKRLETIERRLPG